MRRHPKFLKEWLPTPGNRERPEADWKRIMSCGKKEACSSCEKSLTIKKVIAKEKKEFDEYRESATEVKQHPKKESQSEKLPIPSIEGEDEEFDRLLGDSLSIPVRLDN